MQYDNLQQESGMELYSPWTEERYEEEKGGKTGIRGCYLNQLDNFHCTSHLPLDLLHDFLEGNF